MTITYDGPVTYDRNRRVRCASCGAWGKAIWEWPDGLVYVGVRCEHHARVIAEIRAASAGTRFVPRRDLTSPPPPPDSRLERLPPVIRRRLP